MENIILPSHMGEFAKRQGKRFEVGTRAFNAVYANRDKLGLLGWQEVGRPRLGERSFLFWVIDRQHLTRRDVWNNYRGIGRVTVDFLIDFQMDLLRRHHQALKRLDAA